MREAEWWEKDESIPIRKAEWWEDAGISGMGWMFGILILGLLACLIFLLASIIVWICLFAACFLLIFVKPLRGILGFGIAALSLYLCVRLQMKGQTQVFPLLIASASLIWLAPLMALSKRPFYVLLAFVLFGAVAGLVFLGVPYLITIHPPQHGSLWYNILYDVRKLSHGVQLLVSLGILVSCIMGLAIGIWIPFLLMEAAFSEDSESSSRDYIGAFLLAIALIVIAVGAANYLLDSANKVKTLPKRATGSVNQTQPNEYPLGVYLLTDTNYDPANWRLTPKCVFRSVDGGKTWIRFWELKQDSPEIISHIEARDRRSEVERLPSGQRDIIIFINRR